MKKTVFSKILSFILCLVLVAAIALTVVGCNGNDSADLSSSQPNSSDASSAEEKVLGEGATQISVNITFKDGSEKFYTVKTDKTTVGEALQEVKLIKGTVGDYGLMIETVDGETVTYENDKKYWAFYVNGEYAMTGVDSTKIESGATYGFKVEE